MGLRIKFSVRRFLSFTGTLEQCRNKVIGWDRVACISELWNNPTSDLRFVELFVEAIAPSKYVYFERLNAFLKHDGAIWKQASCLDLGQEIIKLCTSFLKQLTIGLAEELLPDGAHSHRKRALLREKLHAGPHCSATGCHRSTACCCFTRDNVFQSSCAPQHPGLVHLLADEGPQCCKARRSPRPPKGH